MIVLPRQARDKHREITQKGTVSSSLQAEVGAQIEAKDALLRTVEALEAANTKGDAERDELQEGLGSMQEMVTELQDEMKVSHTPALHYTMVLHGTRHPT
eukprot:COSAG06_NODE_8525_length_2140_cov_1.611955_2_plen_100_part_00